MNTLPKLFAFFACLFAWSSANAQSPILTQAGQQPQVGDQELRFYHGNTISAGTGGANATWNFSLTPTQLVDTFHYVSPPTQYQYPFGSANLAAQGNLQTIGGTTPGYLFYQTFPDSTEYHGWLLENVADFGPGIYHNPYPLLTFPFEYGDSFRNAIAGEFQGIFVLNFTGFVDMVADGYGSLTLNGTNYPNVLRVHEKHTYQWSGSSFPNAWDEAWYWYDPASRFPVLTILNTQTGLQVFTSNSLATSRREIETIPAVLFPNPGRAATNIRFQIDAGGEVVIRVINTLGQHIDHQTHQLSAGKHQLALETPSDAGVYFVEIHADGKVGRLRWVVQ